jgi:SET domain-containing protein
MLLPNLVIAPSKNRGRGVYTTKNIAAGTVIEISPIIELSPKDRKQIEGTKLYHYIFEWGKSKRKAAVALGYVSMYNHSFDPNCEYEMDYENGNMTVRTIKSVKKGEELCFSYNGDPADQSPLWFKTT